MMGSRRWSENELLLAFRLYCRTPFGKLHQRNPEIIELSRVLDRTPSAVAMKACNFASLDPLQKARNIRALENVSNADRHLWERFQDNPEQVAFEAEKAYAALMEKDTPPLEKRFEPPGGPSEVERIVRARRVQGFFRDTVLISYNNRCALSDIAVPELLNASHIIPWSVDEQHRADPRNGIALNALYDRAFDRGLITFDTSLHAMLSSRLKHGEVSLFHREALLCLEGRKLRLPDRFSPDPSAMAYHREHIFIA